MTPRVKTIYADSYFRIYIDENGVEHTLRKKEIEHDKKESS